MHESDPQAGRKGSCRESESISCRCHVGFIVVIEVHFHFHIPQNPGPIIRAPILSVARALSARLSKLLRGNKKASAFGEKKLELADEQQVLARIGNVVPCMLKKV